MTVSSEQDSWLLGLGVNIDKVLQAKQETEASIQASLQSTQDSAFEAMGVSPETAANIKSAQQAIADFQKGRDAGRAEGSAGLIGMLPPVQLAKALSRISDAEDPEAEIQKIAEEKLATIGTIGRLGSDPIAAGSEFGESFGNATLQAQKEGRLAEFAGNLAGHADVIAATVAAGGIGGAAEGVGAGAAEAGAARGVAGGAEAAGARGLGVVAEEGGVVVRVAEGADAAAPTVRAPVFGEPIIPSEFPATEFPPTEFPPTEFPATEPGIPPTIRSPTSPLGEPISPAARSVPAPNVGEPIPSEFPPTELPPGAEPIPPTLQSPELVSPLAESVPAPNFVEPIPDTFRTPGPEPFEPAPSFELPPDTVPSFPEPFNPTPSFELPPDTLPSLPDFEPFNPAPSFEG